MFIIVLWLVRLCSLALVAKDLEKLEVMPSSETLVTAFKTTQHHNQVNPLSTCS